MADFAHKRSAVDRPAAPAVWLLEAAAREVALLEAVLDDFERVGLHAARAAYGLEQYQVERELAAARQLVELGVPSWEQIEAAIAVDYGRAAG